MTVLEQSADAASSRRAATVTGQTGRSGQQRPDAGDLTSYARNARRSLRGALVGAVIGGLAAGALLLAPSDYTGKTTVRIYPAVSSEFDNSRSASGLIDPATEAAVAQSDRVFELAVSEFGPLDAEVSDLRQAVDVTPIEASTVLEVAVTAGSPAEAQRQADAVAMAYLERRAQTANNRQDALIEALKANIASVNEERMAAGARFKAAPRKSDARMLALTEHRAIVAQRDSLEAQLESVEELSTNGGEVLTSAESVPVTTNPDRRVTLASGVVGGAVLGFLLAFLLGQFGPRVRRLDDLGRVPALGFTAQLRRRRGGRGEVDLETFRALREQRKIDGWPEAPYSTILVLDHRRTLGLGTPLGLAQALAQEHGSAIIMALGWEDDKQGAQLEALGFRPEGSGYVTSEGPHVGLRTHARDDSIDVADSYLTDRASDELTSVGSSPRPIVLWCPGSCPESTRLALFSRSDTLLVSVEPGSSRLADLRTHVTEATDAGVSWTGALLVR